MQDPIAQELSELLGLASDIKSRLRQLEARHNEQPSASEIDTGSISRTRHHLELILEALGRPTWGFASAPASSLKITGFFSSDIYKALREIRSAPPKGDDAVRPEREGKAPMEVPDPRHSTVKADDEAPSTDETTAADESSERTGAVADPEKPHDGGAWLMADSAPASGESESDEAEHPRETSTDDASEDDGKPSAWVQHRVSEIHRALSAAFGDEDMASEESVAPKPFAPPEFVGNTNVLAVPELIGFFQMQRKTGILTIDARHEQFTLEYLSGELIHARSTSSPPGERLGEILVQLGHITESKLQRLLAGKTTAERIGDALRRGDIIDEAKIAQALEVQVQRIFHRMFGLQGCRFTFREGLEGEPRARVRYNVTRLLLETARHHDEQQERADGGRLAS